MMVAPSYYWNVVHGGAPGELFEDKEGICVIKNLANNMAWMLNIKEYAKVAFPVPDPVDRTWTNFVR
jgi:hypothetical protein